MLVFCIIMFSMAVVMATFGIRVSRGHTDVINCYRPERVKDKLLYCKKFSQALWMLSITAAVSGTVSLLGETDAVALPALGVLVVGVFAGTGRLLYVQRKYGGGIL